MKQSILFILCCISIAFYAQNIRPIVDTVGFVTEAYQMDSLINRINRIYESRMDSIKKVNGIEENTAWRAAICPHDDYAYASYLYPLVIEQIKAKVVIIIGVCHKAALFGLKDRLIFDNYDFWMSPTGKVKVSDLRNEIIEHLPEYSYVIHNEVQTIEHSVEAMIPFLHYYNPDVEIIPILVPYMDFDTLDKLSQILAKIIDKTMLDKDWGEDYAILISNDAVHYGSEDWGNSNFALLGTGKAGYEKAIAKEYEIIDQCFTKELNKKKIEIFNQYTVNENDPGIYKWTWCGRFSIPLGLLTSFYLQSLTENKLDAMFLDYATSIDHKHIQVKDIGLGTTAPAKINHWVGYLAVGYK